METANEVSVSANEAQNIINYYGETIAELTTPNPDGDIYH